MMKKVWLCEVILILSWGISGEWVGQNNHIDHLSPAKAETGTELGKINTKVS